VLAASREIAVGDADVAIAGGVESMSRAPWVVAKPERPYERTSQQMYSTTLGWRLVNPRLSDEWTVPLGEGAEILAERLGIARGVQDAFAVRSHQHAARAWREGRFDDEVVPPFGTDLTTDESVRPDTTADALARLTPVFRRDGSVTAGNSSPMNDGAAALLLATEQGLRRHGLEPKARIVSSGAAGVHPDIMGIGPVPASEKALGRAGISAEDLDLVELNEAFASQSLASLRLLQVDPEKVNVNGGAIAIGHPLGASGARILTTLVHELVRRQGRYGLATMCIGVGQGISTVIERV
jgi:acetyl-CoA acyltransferase